MISNSFVHTYKIYSGFSFALHLQLLPFLVQEGILFHPNYGSGLIDGLSSSVGSILFYILLSRQSKHFGENENMLLLCLNFLMSCYFR